jgi:cysteine-rich repeat protein
MARLPRIARLSSLGLSAALLAGAPASALDVQGTVSFAGSVVFAAPIAGLDPTDLRVRVDPATDATGPGVKCSLLSSTGDVPDAFGAYPDAGAVTAELLMERGGPQLPDGACLVTLRVSGGDGLGTSAHGATTLLVTAADLQGASAIAVPDLTVRASKAFAELAKDCKKWAKKQLKLRDKCNATILKLGGAVAVSKCKEAPPEPADCDPGDHVEAALALAHGGNDQQVDVPSGEAVDLSLLGPQAKCQKLFGKAAVKFLGTLAARIQSECVKPGDDSEACRAQQVAAARKKLDKINDCAADAAVDPGTGRTVPQVGEPCDVCIVGGAVDRKCLQSCFETSLAELASGLVGDVPVCGDGVVQNLEFCDDGNLDDGDCCSSLCGAEDLGDQSCGVGACQVTVSMCMDGGAVLCEPGAPGVESTLDGSCSNGIDDDCDGLTDAADPDCIP